MTEQRKIVIVAPHVDDEMIGCWSLISEKMVSDVIYLFETDSTRRAEAMDVAKEFKFTPHFFDTPKDLVTFFNDRIIVNNEGVIGSFFTVYVPHPSDPHPDHQTARNYVESLVYKFEFEVKYYSTAMNIPGIRKLSVDDSTLKKDILDAFYPSQKKLWNNDAKYYLFEGIFDHPSPPWIEVKVNYLGGHSWEDAPRHRSYLRSVHQHLFEVILRLYPSHLDRQFEFHDMRLDLWEFLQSYIGDFKNELGSCENIAKAVYYWAKTRWNGVRVEVFVAEEGGLKARYGDVNGR